MVEGAVWLLKLTIKIGFMTVALLAFILIFGFVVNGITVALNGSFLQDILAFMQIWLPFNFNTVLAWLLTIVFAWVAYKVAWLAYSWILTMLRD